MKKDKTCGQCALYRQGACLMHQEPRNAEKDYCSKFTEKLYQCEICGNPILTPILLEVKEAYKIVCGNCYGNIGTCHLCTEGSKCEFETNPSPLPKQVMKTIRQGNSVMQTTIRNPERERQFCHEGCKCFNAEGYCNKQFNHCGNHKFVLEE